MSQYELQGFVEQCKQHGVTSPLQIEILYKRAEADWYKSVSDLFGNDENITNAAIGGTVGALGGGLLGGWQGAAYGGIGGAGLGYIGGKDIGKAWNNMYAPKDQTFEEKQKSSTDMAKTLNKSRKDSALFGWLAGNDEGSGMDARKQIEHSILGDSSLFSYGHTEDDQSIRDNTPKVKEFLKTTLLPELYRTDPNRAYNLIDKFSTRFDQKANDELHEWGRKQFSDWDTNIKKILENRAFQDLRKLTNDINKTN